MKAYVPDDVVPIFGPPRHPGVRPRRKPKRVTTRPAGKIGYQKLTPEEAHANAVAAGKASQAKRRAGLSKTHVWDTEEARIAGYKSGLARAGRTEGE